MRRLTFSVPDELAEAIDRDRAESGIEDGEIKDRSKWLREAAREKLGEDDGTLQERGAA